MIATVHEMTEYVEETFSTLSFANRASRLRMTLAASEGVSESITLDGAKQQIRMLRQRLQEMSLALMNANHASSGITSKSEELPSDLVALKEKALTNKCCLCEELMEHVQALAAENLNLKVKLSSAMASPSKKGFF